MIRHHSPFFVFLDTISAMKITLAQLNPCIGDLESNAKKILASLKNSRDSDLLVTGELALCGYPPLDLIDWETFISHVQQCNDYLISQTSDTALLFGSLYRDKVGQLRNTAILAHQGKEIGRINKKLLPNYNVFDERRYFTPADSIQLIPWKGHQLGISICEDAWTNHDIWPDCPYQEDIITQQVAMGATHLINLSASPYSQGKPQIRFDLFKNHAQQHKLPLWHVNQVGANDELIFDGGSLAFDADGELSARATLFEESLVSATISKPWPERIEEIYKALTLGIADYFHKSGFSKAVIGLSGGIDSALALCLAAEALGNENVTAVAMPGPYSSNHSLEDAKQLAEALKITLEIFPINSLFDAMEHSFSDSFSHTLSGIARQNAQARMRGQVLMNLSNTINALVITTGNKSELAVGYCTLYGDMCGALAAIGDCPKKLVYDLCSHIKTTRYSTFPESILNKPPSAELAPDQKDQDTLPPYDALDRLVCDYIEHEKPLAELQSDFSETEVKHWLKVIDVNEHKRRQAPPVLRISSRAFGLGRRRPLTQGYNPSWDVPSK